VHLTQGEKKTGLFLGGESNSKLKTLRTVKKESEEKNRGKNLKKKSAGLGGPEKVAQMPIRSPSRRGENSKRSGGWKNCLRKKAGEFTLIYRGKKNRKTITTQNPAR